MTNDVNSRLRHSLHCGATSSSYRISVEAGRQSVRPSVRQWPRRHAAYLTDGKSARVASGGNPTTPGAARRFPAQLTHSLTHKLRSSQLRKIDAVSLFCWCCQRTERRRSGLSFTPNKTRRPEKGTNHLGVASTSRRMEPCMDPQRKERSDDASGGEQAREGESSTPTD